jgi:N-methylhydantoinase B
MQMDRAGRVMAQSRFCPIHMNSFLKVFEVFASRFDLSKARPGEALITNDPYCGG